MASIQNYNFPYFTPPVPVPHNYPSPPKVSPPHATPPPPKMAPPRQPIVPQPLPPTPKVAPPRQSVAPPPQFLVPPPPSPAAKPPSHSSPPPLLPLRPPPHPSSPPPIFPTPSPPPPAAKPPSHSIPPLSPSARPPPHPISPPPPGHHSTVMVVVFVSLGSLLFLALLSVALCCFIKKRKKKMVQETDTVKIDEHVKMREATVPGPYGPQAILLIEEDVHIEEDIKDEIVSEGSHIQSAKDHPQSLDMVPSTSNSSHHRLDHHQR